MTQYTLSKGLQVFRPLGKEAVFRKMQQLRQWKVCEPQKATDLSANQCKASLCYLMFLKQKCSGQIKGQGCADDWIQCLHTDIEGKTLPTVDTEAVILTSTIDAKESRDVATMDIPGAFMHSDLHLQWTITDLLVKCDPKLYRKYVVTEGGQWVLYAEMIKALYGSLQATWLFGSDFPGNWWSGGSPLIPMIGVSPTNLSEKLSVQSYGTSMT